jgi:hypothetical protein
MNGSFFFLFLLMISCMPKTSHVNPNTASKEADRIIRMTKGPCFGTCPVFELEIYSDGRVVFMPRMFTLLEDTATAHWPMEPILSAFNQAGLDTMATEYLQPISDIPTFSITFQKKQIRWNAGAPRVLYQLMGLLDSLAIDEGWLAPNEKGDAIEAPVELILRVAEPGGDLNWLEAYRTYQLNVLRKVDNAGEYLILQYEQEAISASELIRLLRKDPNVKSVSRSRVAHLRD